MGYAMGLYGAGCGALWGCVGQPHLPDDAFDAGQWQPLVVGADDPTQQLVAQHLQHHHHVWGGSRSPQRGGECGVGGDCGGGGWGSQRIRMPLTPEMRKWSMSCTMLSRLGSVGSESRTWGGIGGVLGGWGEVGGLMGVLGGM